MEPIIIHLPKGQWCIEYHGQRSVKADYSERIIDYVAGFKLAGQTSYWGNEEVYLCTKLDHDTKDETL